MSKTPEPSIYEKTFAKSDKTDALLVVDGKKLHVNKAFLSYHSEYFDKLFNSEFKEKSMKEIEIKDVNFKEFAILLSLIHPNPILPEEYSVQNLLELADRFLLPAAKRHLELFIGSKSMSKLGKLRIADKYDLDVLRDSVIESYTSKTDFENIHKNTQHFSERTQAKLYGRYFWLVRFGAISL